MAETGIASALFRAYTARLYYDKVLAGRVFVGIGRTSAWPDDSEQRSEGEIDFEVPPESLGATALDTPIGYQCCDTAAFLNPDNEGEFDFAGTKYRMIDYADLRTEKPQYLYISATIRGDDMPLSTFRQSGLFVDLVRGDGVSEGQETLSPAEVDDPGYLLLLDHFLPRSRSASQKDVLAFLLAL